MHTTLHGTQILRANRSALVLPGLARPTGTLRRTRRPAVVQGAKRRRRSGFKGGADQAEELVVTDGRRVGWPQPDRPLAGPELGMAGGKAAVAVLPPAVHRHAVLPHPDVQAPPADLIGGDPVRDDH